VDGRKKQTGRTRGGSSSCYFFSKHEGNYKGECWGEYRVRGKKGEEKGIALRGLLYPAGREKHGQVGCRGGEN